MAVSYRLYSLYVRPAEIVDVKEVVQVVADITGQRQDQVQARLNEAKSMINVAEQLEQTQVDLIKNARLPGLYVKPVEQRFYPEHETAAGLVGFTGKGIGLSGVEGVYDTLLQDGEFRTDTVEGIDFREEKTLGRAKLDLVLTVDLELQKQLDRQLRQHLEDSDSSRGVALALDPANGAVLAWASQPSFNPNYYWQADNEHSLFEQNIDSELIRRLYVQAAAIYKYGSDEPLLPATVANLDYGLSPEEIENFRKLLAPSGSAKCILPSCGPAATGCSGDGKPVAGRTAPVEWARDVAGMMNGGCGVTPHVLGAVYNHGLEKVYESSVNDDLRNCAFTSSAGDRIRQELAGAFGNDIGGMAIQADSVNRMLDSGGFSEHIMQEVLFGAVPSQAPEMLLLVVTQRDHLYPLQAKADSKNASMVNFGRNLLASLYNREKELNYAEQGIAAAIPKEQNEKNYNQFMLSSRIASQGNNGKGAGRAEVMPLLVGLSLRKGLQKINEYSLQVKVRGSGQIVSQAPGPGESLQGVGECVLILSSEI